MIVSIIKNRIIRVRKNPLKIDDNKIVPRLKLTGSIFSNRGMLLRESPIVENSDMAINDSRNIKMHDTVRTTMKEILNTDEGLILLISYSIFHFPILSVLN